MSQYSKFNIFGGISLTDKTRISGSMTSDSPA